jgi:hypothetical protein
VEFDTENGPKDSNISPSRQSKSYVRNAAPGGICNLGPVVSCNCLHCMTVHVDPCFIIHNHISAAVEVARDAAYHIGQ